MSFLAAMRDFFNGDFGPDGIIAEFKKLDAQDKVEFRARLEGEGYTIVDQK